MEDDLIKLDSFTDLQRQDIKITAYHEAVHAIVGILGGFKIKHIDIRDAWQGGGGGCAWEEDGDDIEETDEYLEKFGMRVAAGWEAEQALGLPQEGVIGYLAKDDNDKLKLCAYGLSLKRGEDVEHVEADLRQKSLGILRNNWPDVVTLSNELARVFFLNRNFIEELLPHLKPN